MNRALLLLVAASCAAPPGPAEPAEVPFAAS